MSDKPSITPPPTSTPRRTPVDKVSLSESLKESAIVAHKEPDYCVDNQMIESRQKWVTYFFDSWGKNTFSLQVDTRVKIRTRVEFTSVEIDADCVCIEQK